MHESRVDISYDTMKRNAEYLFECYDKGYTPPLWSKQNIVTLVKQHKSICYSNSANNDFVRRFLFEREPVNIGRTQHYNKKLLYKHFHYKNGLYDDKRIPYHRIPLIAMYNTSPVKYISGQKGNSWNEVPCMHFIHCIGCAFDHKEQRDYIELLKGKHKKDYVPVLIKRYEAILDMAFKCAIDQNLTHIALAVLGDGAFSVYYEGHDFTTRVFQPALAKVMDRYSWPTHRLSVLGNTPIRVGTTLHNIGNFPSEAIPQINASSTLVMNAWDPLSIVGNGNEMDNSLDGWIGRHTACGLLCSPYTNKYIRFVDHSHPS